MLAVKKNRPSLVELYTSLPLPGSVYLSRDVTASTVLHAAAQRAYTSLARAIARAGPAELLFAENGVGQTAVEVAGLRLLNAWAEAGSGSLPSVQWDLPVDENGLKNLKLQRSDEGVRIRAEEMRRQLDTLTAAGRIDRSSDMAVALFAFAGAMEARIATLPASDEDPSQSEAEKTYWSLLDAARARPAKRQLVHVLDVQQSVEHNVRQAAQEREEEKAAYVPYDERVRTVDDQLKDASIFKDDSMMYMRRYSMRRGSNTSVDWFASADEVY